MCYLIQVQTCVWTSTFVSLWLCIESIHGREWDGWKDRARKEKEETEVSITVHLLARRGLATSRSCCRVAGRDPWPVSSLLTACLHACSGSLPTSSLLIISWVKRTLRKSRSTVSKPSGGFYPLTLFFGHLEWATQICLCDILLCIKFRIRRLFYITFYSCFKRYVFPKVSIF